VKRSVFTQHHHQYIIKLASTPTNQTYEVSHCRDRSPTHSPMESSSSQSYTRIQLAYFSLCPGQTNFAKRSFLLSNGQETIELKSLLLSLSLWTPWKDVWYSTELGIPLLCLIVQVTAVTIICSDPKLMSYACRSVKLSTKYSFSFAVTAFTNRFELFSNTRYFAWIADWVWFHLKPLFCGCICHQLSTSNDPASRPSILLSSLILRLIFYADNLYMMSEVINMGRARLQVKLLEVNPTNCTCHAKCLRPIGSTVFESQVLEASDRHVSLLICGYAECHPMYSVALGATNHSVYTHRPPLKWQHAL